MSDLPPSVYRSGRDYWLSVDLASLRHGQLLDLALEFGLETYQVLDGMVNVGARLWGYRLDQRRPTFVNASGPEQGLPAAEPPTRAQAEPTRRSWLRWFSPPPLVLTHPVSGMVTADTVRTLSDLGQFQTRWGFGPTANDLASWGIEACDRMARGWNVVAASEPMSEGALPERFTVLTADLKELSDLWPRS